MPKTESFTPRPLEEIARAVLAASAGVPPDRVPEILCRAVACGEGDPEAIAEATRSLGPQAGFDLVRFDTDRIAEYVFESSRPPVIAGASKILRELNAKIASDYASWTLLSGGGEGLLLAPRGEGDAICARIEGLYRAKSEGALGVTTTWIEARPQGFVASPGEEAEARSGVRVVSGTPALLSRLHDKIRRKKDERLPDRAPVQGNVPRCRSCRDRAAGSTTLASLGRIDEKGNLCDACHRRWREGRDEIRGFSFEELIAHWIGDKEEAGRKQRYLGFLYADGNGMGALFGKLRSLEELRTLSLEVAGCFAGLRDVVREEARKMLQVREEEEAGRHFLDLLAGGDEVIWILPGTLAVHVAERLDSWLAKAVEARPALKEILRKHGHEGLTVGVGLALTGLGYPVRYQYQLAKALQKEAKKRTYRTGVDESTLDFELLTDSSPISEDLKSLRRLYAKTRESEFVRTCRPYGSHELTALRRSIEAALENQMALSQLYGLAAGSHEGRRHFLNLLRYQIARKPAGERYQAWLEQCGVDPTEPDQIERFFVREQGGETALWIQDALDLMPFLDGLSANFSVRS
jgi:hypothetical protein